MRHPWRTPPCGTKEAEKGADRDDNGLGARDPVQPRTLQDEAAQGLGGVGPRVVAQGRKKLSEDPLVRVDGRFDQPAVLARPDAELPKNGLSLDGRRGRGQGRHNALLAEEPEEQPGGRQRLAVGAAAVPHARPLPERRRAGVQAGGHVIRAEPGRAHPVSPAGERTERRIERDRPVALPVQPGSEVVDVAGGRTGRSRCRVIGDVRWASSMVPPLG